MALPGGAQDFGQTIPRCAISECLEETVITVEVIGIFGVYSDPEYIVEYTDVDVRQEYEVTLIRKPISGRPTFNDEASDVEWFDPGILGDLDIHPTMRRQIDDYLGGTYPHVE